MIKKPIRQQVRQGHTRFLVALYKPDTFVDYPDQWVAMVHACFVTASFGTTVKYDLDRGGSYIAGREWFLKNTVKSRRKALRMAQAQVNEAVFKEAHGAEKKEWMPATPST